ncbi:NADP-dependent L-serine/L-allo-threonine dehydrogenase [Pseudozyma hubeiensis SY62]|uniref:NADP-dependent 3-hydroxy acid dehydrogenase YdfG n=1 Tax=Pseudozyma hubeiensis (strain SY62) TaxID=1305764 RepID=R9P463_PSEHS|nr:NADP-dependent L-serine/L-allo-threonine dehydrogenase [Pseudozyma hubeiensis SY62]GAC96094.1 NADP-dependent L-serine/L-allo-threonine dehydrogenase [Pseudozyma hubeiensis SY62]
MRKVDYPRSTALVTGATSGIGFSIAQELISRGIGKLVIVGKQQDKLSSSEKHLGQKCGAKQEIRSVLVDLTRHDASDYIQKQVSEWGWTIDILVNNAGVATKQNFVSGRDQALSCVDVNVRAVVDLSACFLPAMLERDSGGLLNLGSTAAYQPVPWTATYAATKAFILSWSQAIRQEHIDSGVRIACIVPGITKTNLDQHGGGESRGALDYVSVHQSAYVAKEAVDAYERNSAAQIVGLNNKLLRLAGVPMPARFMAAFVAKRYNVNTEVQQERSGHDLTALAFCTYRWFLVCRDEFAAAFKWSYRFNPRQTDTRLPILIWDQELSRLGAERQRPLTQANEEVWLPVRWNVPLTRLANLVCQFMDDKLLYHGGGPLPFAEDGERFSELIENLPLGFRLDKTYTSPWQDTAPPTRFEQRLSIER